MAGNAGKFIDRSPIICAAGKPLGDPEEVITVGDTLNEYTVEDAIQSVKHDAHMWAEETFKPPLELPPIINPNFRGTQTEIKPIMSPPVKTRYQTLIDDLKETAYDSFWNKAVGKSRYEVPGLPKGMNVLETTFGNPTKRQIPLGELVNPPKKPYEVLYESQVGHELYRKTHNDYNPGEHVQRNYNSPPFVPDRCFGKKSKYDPRGIWVKCCCDWHKKEPVVHASSIQADYLARTRHTLGKPLAPNRNIERVPKGHTFGKRSETEMFGVEELMRDPGSDPCVFKKDYYKWISSLNKFRLKLKERCKDNFSVKDFLNTVYYYDKEKLGHLPIPTFYKLCADFDLTFPKDAIENLMKLLGVICEDRIWYKKFIDLVYLNSKDQPTKLKIFRDVSYDNLYYVTTSQEASCDHLLIDNSKMPPAGVPSIQSDNQRPTVPPGGCRADLENLGEDTSARAVLNPSIYTAYGLNYRDFFVPRSAETIKRLFTKIGHEFPGDSFDKLWKKGLELDNTGGVCVETFKKLVQSHFTPQKIIVDEAEAECDKLS